MTSASVRVRTLAASARPSAAQRRRKATLCETVDRVLHRGAVITGDVIISMAGVDLLYVGLNLVVASIETMRAWDDGLREDG